MALSNSQYDSLMRTYEKRRMEHERTLRAHYQDVYQEAPQVKEIDDAISSLGVANAKKLLDGDESALVSFRADMERLVREKQRLLKIHHFPEDYLELHYTCPDCRDTGYTSAGKCHCLKRAVIDLLYAQSNLQDILEKENFDTFSQGYYSANYIDPLTGRSSRDSMLAALAACHEFVDTFSSDFSNILLYGDTGTGKTFLSHCIARELIEQSYSVIYFSASRLFDLLAKDTFGRKEDDGGESRAHIYGCDLLIIDDLGSELSNSFTVSQLFTLLNERILGRKPTVISTNLTLENIKAIYSERIFSRLSSSYTLLRMTGDDIRIQKKILNPGGTDNGTP